MSARPATSRNPARERLVVLLRPGGDDAAVATAMRCLGRLVPHATVVVAPALPPTDPDATVVTVGADELSAGPLAAASALLGQRLASSRAKRRRP
ncbi:MAG TPA: hypothetical protein VIV57_02070 [Anaeromyxobacter sp.]